MSEVRCFREMQPVFLLNCGQKVDMVGLRVVHVCDSIMRFGKNMGLVLRVHFAGQSSEGGYMAVECVSR